MRTKFPVLLLIVLLSACKSTAPVAMSTATTLPPTPTSTPSPTYTPSPTLTPTPTPLLPLSGSGGGIIAFTSDQDGNMDIYIMNADGSDQRRLTSGNYNDGWAAWSPDGSQIAYHSVQEGGSALRYLNIAYSHSQQWQVKLDGNLWEPAWSHDGQWLAFSNQVTSSESDIYIMNINEKDLLRLTNTAGIDGGPFWSPDDREIAFYSNRDGNFEVYVMNADGSNQRRLTDDPAEDLVTSWAPDGSRLAFFSNRDGNYELYTINVDGSGLTRLTETQTEEREPAFSPDGTQIAFVSDRDGNFEIYVAAAPAAGMPINVGSIRRLTNTAASEMLPAWKPEKILSLNYKELTTIVPVGIPLALDGQFAAGEWDRALRQEVIDDGEVLLMQDGGYLYLGVHENFDGLTVTTVCMEYDGEVSLLHSSGSLGTAIFEKIGSDWRLIRPFAWELYKVTSQTATAENQRQAFLENYGWLANLGSMTETEQIEYKISIPDGAFHIAVAYLLPPDFEQAAWWPSGLADDCRKLEILQGNSGESMDSPLQVKFMPETWVTFNPEYQQSEK